MRVDRSRSVLGLLMISVLVLAGTTSLAAPMVPASVGPAVSVAPAPQQEGGPTTESAWLGLTDAERQAIEAHASGYKAFMAKAKTELSFVAEAVKMARAAGFQELRDDSPLTPGAKYYDVNRDRTIVLMIIGREDLEDGCRIIGAHTDSPRLELKARPLYESQEFVLVQTSNHGGLKNYQWTNLPLAMMGRVDKKDGTTVWIDVGNQPDDPIFILPDLSPHVDYEMSGRSYGEIIQAEEMDPIVGHIPGQGKSVSAMVVDYLKATYDIDVADLVSAELALVPAMPPRDIGFDRGLMAIYGQDDRLSSYAALRAILDTEAPQYTALAYLVDNEEVGNVNNTGAASSYLVDLLSRLMYMDLGDDYREPMLRRALAHTHVISADVNPGVHPIWPGAFERGNAARLGYGIGLKLYGRGFNANSEYIAWIRDLFDREDIPWQTIMYKVGRGGGGTIGSELSDENMNVIDMGVPVLSIHTPYGVSSKVDVYALYRGFRAFFGG